MKGATILGDENTMEEGADVGHGAYSAVPPGLWQYGSLPGVETPGYCRLPLCGMGQSMGRGAVVPSEVALINCNGLEIAMVEGRAVGGVLAL